MRGPSCRRRKASAFSRWMVGVIEVLFRRDFATDGHRWTRKVGQTKSRSSRWTRRFGLYAGVTRRACSRCYRRRCPPTRSPPRASLGRCSWTPTSGTKAPRSPARRRGGPGSACPSRATCRWRTRRPTPTGDTSPCWGSRRPTSGPGSAGVLLAAGEAYLRARDRRTVLVASYAPGYFIPGVDVEAQLPEASGFFLEHGYREVFTARLQWKPRCGEAGSPEWVLQREKQLLRRESG